MREDKPDKQMDGEEQKVGSIVRNALKREQDVLAKAANGQGELNPDK
ncbi:hypothetical protein [Propionispora vibrioides]|uniref:Uncharacterized protein n=1 Tax=Propionispora vibrioides TaxID=112903 RepID=A0A1H8TE58_9FIRM|nr:hypothetical protein [Propionispora vibrioides]SEO89202.1 hypothetical protein SAMN04490178_106138 [Propionispora vibrioides]